MKLFSNHNGQLTAKSERPIAMEKDLQGLTESNLEAIWGYKFVSTEFQLHDLRIDTLAFDEESNAFVIVEYKRDRNLSVIDQGYAYLSLMLNNKADFILEYTEATKQSLQRQDIDWSQSKVIFVAPVFTVHQRNAINFKDLPIELWEAKKYDGELYAYNRISADDSSESIKTVSRSQTVKEVSKEVQTFTVDQHFVSQKQDMRGLYDELREALVGLDSRFEENPRKPYIGFKIGTPTVLYLHVFKGRLRLDIPRIKPDAVKDPEGKVRYRENSPKHKNVDVSEMDIVSSEDVTYALSIVRQVRDKFFGA